VFSVHHVDDYNIFSKQFLILFENKQTNLQEDIRLREQALQFASQHRDRAQKA
jgi:hypothetical protein